jgi:4'-phosphopantetheinyl transferase
MIQLCFMAVGPRCDSAVINEMIQSLSGEKKERLSRYRVDIDRKLGAYAEALVRCLICMKSGVKYKELEFKASGTGKPYLLVFPYYEFSISHTRNAVAAAVSDKPVGVDVEKVRDVAGGLAKRVFSENEMAWLNETDENKERRFFDIWTKKEALAKYRGTGLMKDLKLLDVKSALLREKLSSFDLGGYIVSVCSYYELREADITVISEPDFIKMWRNLLSLQ